MCFDVLPRLTERKWSMNSSKPAMSCDQILKLQRKSFSIRRDFQTDEIHKIFCGFSFHLISCSKFGARAYFSSGEHPVKICWSCKDDGAALFSQITNLLERLENMEREWKTRKNSRPRVLSETSAPSASPAPPTGTQGSGMSPSPVSSEGRKEEKKGDKGDFAFQAWPGESFEANPFPQSGFESATWGNWADSGGTSSAWPAEGASMSAFPQPAFDGDGYGGWPTVPSAAPADFDAAANSTAAVGAVAVASVGSVGSAGGAGGAGGGLGGGLPGGGLGTGSAPLGPSTPSPAASPAIRARDLGSSSALSTASASSLQLHIKCSMSDIEEVQRDQDRFKQRFVRAAAKAAGVPEYRIRVKSITNI